MRNYPLAKVFVYVWYCAVVNSEPAHQHDPQLLKGVLGLILLRLLAEGESYGYELVTRVHDLGLVEVADGSIYPALTRLEREGHLESRLVASTSGPARKYYRLSKHGQEALNSGTRAWLSLAELVTPLLTGPQLIRRKGIA
jgi:PadR family transcriptional regulator, regulatory protein PadR